MEWEGGRVVPTLSLLHSLFSRSGLLLFQLISQKTPRIEAGSVNGNSYLRNWRNCKSILSKWTGTSCEPNALQEVGKWRIATHWHPITLTWGLCLAEFLCKPILNLNPHYLTNSWGWHYETPAFFCGQCLSVPNNIQKSKQVVAKEVLFCFVF